MVEEQLRALHIRLPEVRPPVANYQPFVLHRHTLYLSGQLPLQDGVIQYGGKVGKDINLVDAQRAARLCGVNLLALIKTACNGDWERLDRVLKLGVFVNATPGFSDEHLVANGVSDFFISVLGDRGKHARAAVGVAELPLHAAVEVDAICALK